MSSIERFSYKLSKLIGQNIDKSEEEIAVINYGLFILMHTTLSIIMTLVVGIILNLPLEIMIISFCSAILKRYSGGIHASTPYICTTIGVILSTAFSIMGKCLSAYFSIKTLITFFIVSFVICYYILYKKCPMPSKHRPLKNKTIRAKARKKCFTLINIYILLVIISIYLHIITNNYIFKSTAVCIILGTYIQSIAITKIGQNIILSMDKILYKIHIFR